MAFCQGSASIDRLGMEWSRFATNQAFSNTSIYIYSLICKCVVVLAKGFVFPAAIEESIFKLKRKKMKDFLITKRESTL